MPFLICIWIRFSSPLAAIKTGGEVAECVFDEADKTFNCKICWR